jgi:hypothetical protein
MLVPKPQATYSRSKVLSSVQRMRDCASQSGAEKSIAATCTKINYEDEPQLMESTLPTMARYTYVWVNAVVKELAADCRAEKGPISIGDACIRVNMHELAQARVSGGWQEVEKQNG